MTDTIVTETEEKAAYAALLLKDPDPFRSALALFPNNTNRALWVANHWPQDAEVVGLLAKIRENNDEMSFLPGKPDLARDIWDRMQGKRPDGSIVPPTTEDYAKLAKLYAEVRGFIEKPAAAVVNNNVVVPRAIEVPTHGTDEDWEAAAEKQQQELLNVSRSRH